MLLRSLVPARLSTQETAVFQDPTNTLWVWSKPQKHHSWAIIASEAPNISPLKETQDMTQDIIHWTQTLLDIQQALKGSLQWFLQVELFIKKNWLLGLLHFDVTWTF